jgi:hypothetical protein
VKGTQRYVIYVRWTVEYGHPSPARFRGNPKKKISRSNKRHGHEDLGMHGIWVINWVVRAPRPAGAGGGGSADAFYAIQIYGFAISLEPKIQ